MLEKIPAPPLHVPIPPFIVPNKATVALLKHIALSRPAERLGGLIKVIVELSETAGQIPFCVVVRVKVREPELISAAVGV